KLTGIGNTFNIDDPQCLKLVIECLRYWVIEMHVDGFRFDLAAILGLDPGTGKLCFDKASPFFKAVRADDVLPQVKLFAEPWALGGLTGVGQFPPPWSEWNDAFRDTVRFFWKGKDGQVGAL